MGSSDLPGRRGAWGEVRKYVRDVVLPYHGPECLIWPFSRDKNGYARGVGGLVSREVCAARHGPSPSRDHHAAHLCGNGAGGCVSPDHIVWKTRVENEADKVGHGTAPRGERNGFSVLTKGQVDTIRSLRGVESQRAIAARFGVNQSQVSRIITGERWSLCP